MTIVHMKFMIKKFSHYIYAVLNSRKFFYVVVGVLLLQAIWIALTAQYPMPFDESYHFGIIQIYSHQWTPFINASTHYAGYGDITRYDSYMYHYLMSFPYRLVTLFTQQQVAQIIILRLLNIGLFVGGLFLFRRLLRRVHLSEGLTNFSLLVFVLIPVVPFLAATINYDNLVFLLVPLLASLALTSGRAITTQQKIPAISFILLLVVGGLASLVKYAFVPVFAATILYLFILFLRSPSKKPLLASLVRSFQSLKHWLQILLVASLIVSGGLVAERYGGNLIQYHSFEPDCSDVQDLSDCLQYGPWGRNYQLAANVKTTNPDPDPALALYVPTWITDMVYRLYYTINYDFSTYAPLPIPITVASIIGGLGLLLCILFWRAILRIDRHLLLFTAIIVLYVGGLFYVNFTEYLRYREVVAVNGRYLIVILPLLFAWIGLAYRQLFLVLLKARVKTFTPLLSLIVILLLLQGGGAATYLLRSQAIWYWQDQDLINFNLGLQKTVAPLTIGGK